MLFRRRRRCCCCETFTELNSLAIAVSFHVPYLRKKARRPTVLEYVRYLRVSLLPFQ